jgi:hypothetical protein
MSQKAQQRGEGVPTPLEPGTETPWIPVFRLKIPAPRTGNWLTSYGSWEGFCQAAQKSIGRNLGAGVVKFSEKLRETQHKAVT